MHTVLNRVWSAPWIAMSIFAATLAACAPASTPSPNLSPIVSPVEPALVTQTPALTLPSAIPTQTQSLAVTSPATQVQSSTVPASTSIPVLTGQVTINDIKMTGLETGWAEGEIGNDDVHRILRTADGGETWSDVSPALIRGYGRHAFFLDDLAAWAWNAREGGFWRTEDSGQSWTKLEINLSGDMWFNDSRHGWRMEVYVAGMSAVHYDIIFFGTTQDGGQTWEELDTPPGGRGAVYMAYPDELTAWTIRPLFATTPSIAPNLVLPFFMYTTSDGGSSWLSYEMPIPSGMFRTEINYDVTPLDFLDGDGSCEFISPVYSSTRIWKLILKCQTQSWMYTTATQSKTWIVDPLPGSGQVLDVHFVDPSVGWMLRGNELDPPQNILYHTSSGGNSWSQLMVTEWTNAKLEFVNADIGWAIAYSKRGSGSDTVKELVKTNDGGRTWQILEPRVVQ